MEHTHLTILGTLTGVAPLVMMAISLGTHHWLEYNVDENILSTVKLQQIVNSEELLFTRSRGLFRTCIKGFETYIKEQKVWITKRTDQYGENCLAESGYELPRRNLTLNWGRDYATRIHLIRLQFACCVLAPLFQLLASLVGIICALKDKSLASLVRLAGTLTLISVLFTSGCMASFHIIYFLERQKIKQPQFPAGWLSDPAYQVIHLNTDIRYGYSYALGWVSIIIAVISAILLFMGLAVLTRRNSDGSLRMLNWNNADFANTLGAYYAYGTRRNRAYDLVDQDRLITTKSPGWYMMGLSPTREKFDVRQYASAAPIRMNYRM